MTPMEEYTTWGEKGPQTGNARAFNITCRPVTMLNCQTDFADNKWVLNRNSFEVLEARQAISDYIDKTINPQRFEELSYKVDVLMGVTCAYKQGNKICLDLHEHRISDVDVELRPCYVCVEKKSGGPNGWDFGETTCYPGNPYMID